MTKTQRLSTLLIAAVFLGGVVAVTTATEQTSETVQVGAGLAKATFAGGCFWCMEPPFDKLDGVISTTSGYTGGARRNPTYQEVSAGRTRHAEAVEIVYDPSKIS
jgi:peptide methionine sulfoxide reductase MsrA